MLRGNGSSAVGFDPHLAERTRAKSVKSYNKEETEWSHIDRILHPQVYSEWIVRFYQCHRFFMK